MDEFCVSVDQFMFWFQNSQFLTDDLTLNLESGPIINPLIDSHDNAFQSSFHVFGLVEHQVVAYMAIDSSSAVRITFFCFVDTCFI